MSYRLFIAEKPSVARDIAAVLGNQRKTGAFSIETDGGVITWCRGHLLELEEPESYGEQFKKPWRFDVLPCVPQTFRLCPVEDAKDQLKAVLALIKEASQVVIATDMGREGELIARELLAYANYKGPLQRLWANAFDEATVRKALASLKNGTETVNNYYAAQARQRADWLVGMNMTRAVTKKNVGFFSIGRVQTPTAALVVRRDREIENFVSRDYFDLSATIEAGGQKATLVHVPKEEARLYDRAAAQSIVDILPGKAATVRRTVEDKTTAPPKLFDISRLQKRANVLWGWTAKHTLDIAQALYEEHKATTYPRVDSEFLPEEHIAHVPIITSALTKLPEFAHLATEQFTPRSSVFNNKKQAAYEHPAIIPNFEKLPVTLDKMNEDERKAFVLIASHYFASLLPDYEYKTTRIFADLDGREFAVKGVTPGKRGWKIAFTVEDDSDDAKAVTLPDIPGAERPEGTPGIVAAAELLPKATKPPARYTEATLLEDMEGVAKYVSDPARKARLKETSGLGTPATRAEVIETIKKREFIAPLKGTQLVSTDKARALITALEADLPALADPSETALWEDGLDDIAKGKGRGEDFVAGIVSQIRQYLEILGKKPDPAPSGPEGKPTGVKIKDAEILDHGDFYSASGAFTGRIYKDLWGHQLTPEEIARLVAGETLDLADCKKRDGSPSGPQKAKYNAAKKPFPGVEILGTAPAAVATTTQSPRKGGGAIQDHGTYYTVPGYEADGRPVRFFKELAHRAITADELAAVLAAKKEGVRMSGFKKADGTPFKSDPVVYYDARKKPFPGLAFDFK